MLKKTIQSAIIDLRRNKSRALLTVFGVTIGIAVVIIVLSAGNGVKGLILGEVDSFGDNWIDIEVKVPSTGKVSLDNAQGLTRGVSITTLTREDADAVGKLNHINDVYAGVTTQVVISRGSEKKQPIVFAVTPSYVNIDKGKIEQGRFFSEEENRSASQVVVLGYGIAKTLFGNEDAVGLTVKINNASYRVVGVSEERGATGFFNYDDILYLPIKTVQKKLMAIDHVLFIIAQVSDSALAESTAEEIRWLMRDRHDISDPEKDDFSVTTQEESIAVIDTIFFGISALLVVLAGISLVVGGVGIMNVMYVSVIERTFEIGLRKSVGARDSDIKRQFLTEAIVLTSVGGFIGIMFGIIISWLIAFGAQQFGLDWAFVISIPSIILGTGFSIGVGIIFGYFPAKRAAGLDPISALRAE
jgi:putative ABC transport system permease protein